MSLNNISLPAPLIVALYKNNLVQNNASAVPAKKPVPFLGKNEKRILIIVNKKETPFLPDAELQFLTQVLMACNLDLSHVAIVNSQNFNKESDLPFLEQFNPLKVLLLDVEPATFGFPQAAFYTVSSHQHLPFVVAPSLSAIESSKEEKKGLWTALKQLFGI